MFCVFCAQSVIVKHSICIFQCIANKAEQLAEEFTLNHKQTANGTEDKELQELRNKYQYYSSKYSMINGIPCTNRPETQKPCSEFNVLKNATATYLSMWLQRDKHFYHISVNTTHTSVHVPTNVFDGGEYLMSLSKIFHSHSECQ